LDHGTRKRPTVSPLSFHEDFPDPLVRLQNEHWIPLIDWIKGEFGVEITTFKGVLFGSQPAASKEKFDKVMSKLDAWEMAGTSILCIKRVR
jgi:ATP synthase mitochondrial F1 complex assembly factor 2